MLKRTVFRQVQQLCSRDEFENCSQKYFQGRKREMTPWRLFQILLLSQLCGCRSLRDIEAILASHREKNYHHGMKDFGKSTIGRAMGDFNEKIYADFAQVLLSWCRKKAPRHHFRFKNKLYSMDSTTISLCLNLFDWAHFRQRKGGVKIHTQLDHDGYIPEVLAITKAKSSDSTQARLLKAAKGDIVVFDRGYNSYKWFKRLDNKGVFFVTRLKSNADYKVLKCHKVTRGKGVISDKTIQLKHKDAPVKLRCVIYFDAQTKEKYFYLTNNFKLCARTIADIYKDRWRIETFFKELKQNLEIKTFMGTSENAVKSQIYITFCAYLLLKLLRLSEGIEQSVATIRKIIATAIFTTKNFQSLFRKEPPDAKEEQTQLIMAWR